MFESHVKLPRWVYREIRKGRSTQDQYQTCEYFLDFEIFKMGLKIDLKYIIVLKYVAKLEWRINK